MRHRDGDIGHLERLAHLALTEGERTLLAERLARLLEWCEVLPPVAAGAATPALDAEAGPTLREDAVAPSASDGVLPPGDRRLADGFVLTPPPSGRCDERD